MRLFKNVDICDLGNILEKGLLSMDECGNDNWDDGRRGNNSTSVVYLFRPKGEINSFPYSYGVALVECDCDAQIHEMSERDVHRDDYVEYVCSRVPSEQIKAVYIPEIFKGRVEIPESDRIVWCKMSALYIEDKGKVRVSDEILQRFAETAYLESSMDPMFFRGICSDGTVLDLYDVQYMI